MVLQFQMRSNVAIPESISHIVPCDLVTIKHGTKVHNDYNYYSDISYNDCNYYNYNSYSDCNYYRYGSLFYLPVQSLDSQCTVLVADLLTPHLFTHTLLYHACR